MAVCTPFAFYSLDDEGTVWVSSSSLVQSISHESQIRAIDACGTLLVALDSEGEVWACNNRKQQELKFVRIVNVRNIVKISCGTKFFMAVDSDREAYGFGANTSGQLGIGEGNFFVSTAHKVETLHDIVHVSCGDKHTAFLDGNGVAYFAGDNQDKFISKSQTYVKTPEELCFPEIIAVECAPSLICFVTVEKNLHVLGKVRQRVNLSELSFPVAISLGTSISIVDSDGSLFVLGKGASGQLGLGAEVTACDTPTKVSTLNNVLYVSKGGPCTVALTGDGVWGFGDNSEGILSTKTDNSIIWKPLHMPIYDEKMSIPRTASKAKSARK